jgi:RHH-type transcriptional regulator, proline utilization regulon repressor / proline dehydrogenase / delta 1-pyrroline-5-carboxylate dehydrogenase
MISDKASAAEQAKSFAQSAAPLGSARELTSNGRNRSMTQASGGLPPFGELAAHHVIDEKKLIGELVERAVFTADERTRAADLAKKLVTSARGNSAKLAGIDAFMKEYGLSSDEGVILMCLAESLLRIPDAATADQLIAEKISDGHWDKHRGHSKSLWVNASTWGLMLTGRVVKYRDAEGANPVTALKRLVARSGEPVIRQAIRKAVRLLGDQFVLGETIKEALVRAKPLESKGIRFSYDMLGEAARTAPDAERYFERYMSAIDAIGAASGPMTSVHPDALMARASVSIKLSALHPRFEPGKGARLQAELLPKLLTLARAARARNVSVTFDTEEQDRLEPTLALFGAVFTDPALDGWPGLGLAVQAYGRRAMPTLRWVRRLAEQSGKRIPVRLVKGAYWDSEIKRAQERGLSDYPVFTRKVYTDVSYLACVRYLLADPNAFYPQFGTHNAHSLASAYVAGGRNPYEFQRLYGMGESLFDEVVGPTKLGVPCRIYAPIGTRGDLVAYLVRRLLENGANTSFVHRMADDEVAVADLVADPVVFVERERARGREDRAIFLNRPTALYEDRKGSLGLALDEPAVRTKLSAEMATHLQASFAVGPIVDGVARSGSNEAALVRCPHDRRERIGTVEVSTPEEIEKAVASADACAHAFNQMGVTARAKALETAANLMERDRARLMAVMIREAGKTWRAAHDDVSEAVDFLRYYAIEAVAQFGEPTRLPGVTGERNVLTWRGRGPVACLSPWNFPLAIFVGQVAAALAAGNPVLAKCAPQTPVTAFLATQLLHEAGIPANALQLLTGDGRVGSALVGDMRIKAIAFTGSNDTAWRIQRALADRRGAIIPFIAETGGLNAMIADSSALPEQVVRDVVASAYDSAGQRCSAARVLFIHAGVADKVIEMLVGAVEQLDIGDPMDYATDIGPVIDMAAQDVLDAHKIRLQTTGRQLVDMALPEECRVGTYVTPAAYEVERLSATPREIFGPILQVVRYEPGALDKVVAAINATGFGLTLGVHSRIAAVADYVAEHAKVGNLYVNRNQIGARVGAQPFGGDGLSGTGPKAGGPELLKRFATEHVRSTDITATGGNWQLLGGEEG